MAHVHCGERSGKSETREDTMGMFKQLKDLKQTVEAAPAMIEQAQALGAQAQQMAAAQQAAAQAQAAAALAAAQQASLGTPGREG